MDQDQLFGNIKTPKNVTLKSDHIEQLINEDEREMSQFDAN